MWARKMMTARPLHSLDEAREEPASSCRGRDCGGAHRVGGSLPQFSSEPDPMSLTLVRSLAAGSRDSEGDAAGHPLVQADAVLCSAGISQKWTRRRRVSSASSVAGD